MLKIMLAYSNWGRPTTQHLNTLTYTRLKRSISLVMYTHLPCSTCMVVLSVSNPIILSDLHLKTSALLASDIVIVETFPLVG